MQPAVSGHYRFRDLQVYRPAALSTIWKLAPQEPVTQDETGLRRNCASRPAIVCAAQQPFSSRLGDGMHEAARIPAAANLPATLVLEPHGAGFLDRRRQFCSDCDNEITAQPRHAKFGLTAAKQKRRDFQAYQDWLTREGTPCHGRSFLGGNSLLLPPCRLQR
ncbi:hypothetical protein [Bradyrhizobium lablabi]|uniref:hypothetical protein n=1 Tax=Bradyrhizobium lablabi TaxID=722472 RepID=UPI0012ABE517|nr:hypothetical protein [Bradyrhizobium lablabi]